MIGLSEEQRAIVRMAADFAEKEIAPFISDWDRDAIFSRETWDRIMELGLGGIMVPEEYGGAGLDHLTYALVTETLTRKAKGIWPAMLAVHWGAEGVILDHGSEEQKQKFLVPLATGRKLGGFAMTEPNMGSDAAALETTAELQGNEYVLNGTKRFITFGEEAEIYLVMARTDKRIKGARGISSLVVEKGTPGLSYGRKENKMGFMYSHTGDLEFEDCRIPVENRIGAEGRGLNNALGANERIRLGVAAGAVGLAQAALDEAVEYSKQRIAFDAPIATFQGLQFMMADMDTHIEAARQLTYHAARLRDQHLPAGKVVSMAKFFATEVAMNVTTDAVQIFGGYGYTKEYPVERMMREAKVTQILEGTSQIQKIVIAQHLLGREMVKI